MYSRKHALQLIQRVTVEFVRVVGGKKGLSQAALEVAGGKIFTYGSYRLGVYGPGSSRPSTRAGLRDACDLSANHTFVHLSRI